MSDLAGDVERERKYQARIKRADDFKKWEFSAFAEKGVRDEIEQRVLLNGLDIMQAALWMLKREYYRHQKDCLKIEEDIRKLEKMNVTLPPALRLDLWFEVPESDPRFGGGVK